MREAVLRLRYRYLAGSPARRDPVQAVDRDGHPRHRPADRGGGLHRAIPGFLSPASLADTARQAAEIGFVVLGMALVIVVGGIDLSVGSMFALTDFCALFCLDVLDVAGAGGRRRSRLRSAPCWAQSTVS
jgi:ribose transport system permease protein